MADTGDWLPKAVRRTALAVEAAHCLSVDLPARRLFQMLSLQPVAVVASKTGLPTESLRPLALIVGGSPTFETDRVGLSFRARLSATLRLRPQSGWALVRTKLGLPRTPGSESPPRRSCRSCRLWFDDTCNATAQAKINAAHWYRRMDGKRGNPPDPWKTGCPSWTTPSVLT
jgi:hypothetical protein